MSRSEEAVKGEANCFVVRGVHRSAAKTLDGLRSEGYLQVDPSTATSWKDYFLCSAVYLFPFPKK